MKKAKLNSKIKFEKEKLSNLNQLKGGKAPTWMNSCTNVSCDTVCEVTKTTTCPATWNCA